MADLHVELLSDGGTLKDRQKQRLGGALFGTNEIFPPLQKLKFELTNKHGNLYEWLDEMIL